jgi:hypothetical protein
MNQSDIAELKIDHADLSDLLAPYSNKWVALSPDESRVISVGVSPLDVINQAKNLGITNPILTHVPKNHIPHVI